jgi:hypothetical protein
MMPFDHAFDPVYAAVSEVVEGPQICFNCRRADELFGGGHIIEAILNEIARAEIAIADASTKNPNVFYELGIVHMIKDVEKVIIITQSMDDVPFDIQQFRCIGYDASKAGLERLKGDLIKAFKEVVENSFRLVGRQGEELECDRPLFGLDRCMYTFSIPDIYVGPDAAKFRLILRRQVIGEPVAIVRDDGWGVQVGEDLELPGTGWVLILEKCDGQEATFRVAKRKGVPPRG